MIRAVARSVQIGCHDQISSALGSIGVRTICLAQASDLVLSNLSVKVSLFSLDLRLAEKNSSLPHTYPGTPDTDSGNAECRFAEDLVISATREDADVT